MKKQLTAFLTALLLCAGAMPVSAADTLTNTSGEYEGLTWTLADGVLTVSGEGKVVYHIGSFPDYDFPTYPNWDEYKSEITKIILEDGITGADCNAFRNYPVLETVVLSKEFDTFNSNLFSNCPKLSEIQGIEQIKTFHSYCLTGTELTAENPFVITDGVLRYCEISDPCDIVVPDGVTEIGKDAFGHMMDISSEGLWADPNSQQTIDDLCFTITLPETVQKIDDYAFRNLTKLTEINIPAGVTEIGDYAFFNCVRLDAVTLGKDMQSVGDYAFYSCRELDTLTVLSENVQWGEMAYGTALDAQACYGESELPDHLEDDPYNYDETLGYLISKEFLSDNSDGNYVYHRIDRTDSLVQSDLIPYEYTMTAAFLRSTSASTAKTLANTSGIQFTDLSDLGDANSDSAADSTDAAVLLISAANQGATGESGLTAAQESALDVNGDGAMNAIDGASILKYAAYKGGGGTMTLAEFVYGIEPAAGAGDVF